jgi:regulator of replication initiation timing
MSNKIVNKVPDKSGKKNKYKIEKDFYVNNIEHIKKELDIILEKNKELTLELKNLENFDLTAIQLLHALKIKMNEKLIIKLDMKDELKTIITNSGFNY